MPDLLAHAFIAYTIAGILSWRYDWHTPAYVTVVMAGAFIPDLAKIELLIPSRTVHHLLGVPFDWFALHTAGGVAIAIAIGVVMVAPRGRLRVGLLLSLGAVSHLLADGLLQNPSGRSYAMIWPLTQWHPPTPGLYLSTQPEPTIITGLIACAVWFGSRSRG